VESITDSVAKGLDGGLQGFRAEGEVDFGLGGFAADGEWAFRSRAVGWYHQAQSYE
jgi:hypothetical protein